MSGNGLPPAVVAASAGATLVATTVHDLLNKSASVRTAALVLIDENGTPCAHTVERADPAGLDGAALAAAVASMVAHLTGRQFAKAVALAQQQTSALESFAGKFSGRGGER